MKSKRLFQTQMFDTVRLSLDFAILGHIWTTEENFHIFPLMATLYFIWTFHYVMFINAEAQWNKLKFQKQLKIIGTDSIKNFGEENISK